jgi:hypothetical protein
MAILSGHDIARGAKQRVQINKTASRTAVAAQWTSVFDQAGNPGAGTLSFGNTANGVVPTDAVAGHPRIEAFGGGLTGYLSGVEWSSTVACRMMLVDVLFGAGAYAFNANTSLTAQPSFAARLPASGYYGLELWVEAVTAFTGNLTVTVNYTDTNDVARTAVLATGAALIVGRKMQIPLVAGGQSIKSITSVVGSVATAGTFNVMLVRRLWTGRVRSANDGGRDGWDKTLSPQMFEDAALQLWVAPDSTATGIPELTATVLNV